MNLVERVVQRYAGVLKASTFPLWHITINVKRALAGIESGNIHDNLKSLADALANLNRVQPPLDADIVRKAHDLSRRILIAQKAVFDVLFDASNLFVALEHAEEMPHDVGGEKFASSGYAQSLKVALSKAEENATNLVWQYDDTNKAFLRMGLR
jgi:hypothetical protein